MAKKKKKRTTKTRVAAPQEILNDQLHPKDSRECPVCGQVMGVKTFHMLQINVCAEHGVWLDKGQLKALLRNDTATNKILKRQFKDRLDPSDLSHSSLSKKTSSAGIASSLLEAISELEIELRNDFD